MNQKTDEKNGLLPDACYLLDNQVFLLLEGPDSETFLQGQISCDLKNITPKHSGLACHCTPKGRMVSSFRLFNRGDNAYLLRLHRSIAETALNRLQKYIVFSKAEASLQESFSGTGLHGPKAKDFLESHFFSENSNTGSVPDSLLEQSLIRAEGSELPIILVCTDTNVPAYEIYAEEKYISKLYNKMKEILAPAKIDQHYLVQHGLGLALIEMKTSEEFIPQHLNYQKTPAISFNKGCYTGQEVIARTHYLGKVKKPMFRFTAKTTQDVFPGDPISLPDSSQPIGMIASAVAISDDEWDILANLPEKNTDQNALVISDTPANDVTFLELSYPE